MLFRSDLDIEFEDPNSGEITLLTLKVEYQWSLIQCAKCKKFGHNCASSSSSNGPKPQKPISRPFSSHSRRKQNYGIWMVVSKGKAVINQTLTDVPTTSSSNDILDPNYTTEAVKPPHSESESKVSGDRSGSDVSGE